MTPVALTLGSLAAKGSVVLALTGIAAALVRRRSAATRHWVWTLGLTSALLLPLLSELVPAIELPVLPLESTGATVSVGPPLSSPAVDEITTSRPAPQTVTVAESTPRWQMPWLSGDQLIGLGWLVGVVGYLVWIAAGEWRVRRLGRLGLEEVGPEWTSLFQSARMAVGVGRAVRLVELPDEVVPMTYGWFRPVVVVPLEGRRWSEQHRFDVLVHELAHVARYDCLTHGWIRLAQALHWYNPLMWVASRQARIEREHACDDVVLAAGAVPSRYAEELLATASTMHHGNALAASAGLGMARRSTLTDRLLSVLDADRARAEIGRRSAALMGAAALLLIVPVAGLVPVQPPPARPSVAPRAPVRTPTPTDPSRPFGPANPAHGAITRSSEVPVATGVAVGVPPLNVVRTDQAVPSAGSLIGALDGLQPVASPAGAPAAHVEDGLQPTASAAGAPAAHVASSVEIRTAEPSGALGIRSPLAAIRSWFTQSGTEPCRVDRTGNRTVRLTSSMSITGEGSASDGKNSYVAWTGRNCSVMIRATGTVTFTPAESDVASLSEGGRFTITHVEGKTEREYNVRVKSGTLARQFTIDGEPAQEDAAFTQWRATLILSYIRRSGYDAEGRVQRILASRGVDGVLQEIDEMGSDWASGIYLRTLLKRASLDGPTVAKIVTRSKKIDSDYELGQILAVVPTRFLESESVKAAFAEAAGTMESDFELRKVLGTILGQGRPSPALAAAMLDLAGTIESDFELASLLTTLATSGAVLTGNEPAYLKAVRSIDSDFEKHRVLTALLQSGTRSPTTVRTALEAAVDIESDFELATWLKEVVAASPLTDELRPGWFSAAATIESDFELRGVLSAALARDKVPAEVIVGVLKEAPRIESDFELATLLVTMASRGMVTPDVRPAFRQALATIDGSFERQRVLAALGERSAEI